MKNNPVRLIQLILVGALASAAPSVALAWCQFPPWPVTTPLRMDMGLVLVPQNLPVGAVVKTYRGSAGTGDVWYCGPSGGSITFENVVLWGDPVAGRSDVFSTNVPGIGYRLSLVDSGWTSTLFPGSRTIVIGPGSQAGRFAQWNWMFQLEIIKTADRVGNGPVSSVPVGRIQQGADATKRLVMAQIGDIRILAPSCQVAVGSRNQTVNLGQEFRNRFRGVGSTTAGKDFQVVVNCQASPNGIENMVSLTMDATPDASSTPGVLGIDTGTGTASGVGIQVLDSAGQPVAFGQPKQLGQSKDGDYVVPFKARYYQIASAVGGGQANGRATVTLSYK